MMKNFIKNTVLGLIVATMGIGCYQPEQHQSTDASEEPFRPQFHFTPKENWMNDPNGMVYYDGEYHLFFQYYPEGTEWGPMHWGHAISTDLVNWEEQEIKLYPDDLGFIFSGSAVADHDNTAGFKTGEETPLVAIFTHHHDEKGQVQSLAYSNDKGRTWEKYEGNPVLPNPGIADFRDPKVSWHEESRKWIMALAVKDVIHLYSSKDLKDWTLESEFGEGIGAKGGVWECPDLFELEMEDGSTKWVMFISINPGAPNGGSGTQYFTGDFDGTTFTPEHQEEKWLDWGTDNYAGVTWANIPEEDGRTLFIGWMSNWTYATVTPTENYRSAMTLARELKLVRDGGENIVTSIPVSEFYGKLEEVKSAEPFNKNQDLELPGKKGFVLSLQDVSLGGDETFKLHNDDGEEITLRFDNEAQKVYLDRTKSGKVDFHEEFASVQEMPLRENLNKIKMDIVVDASSVEIFINDGAYVMTAQVFNTNPFTTFGVHSSEEGVGESGMVSIYEAPSIR
jgi:fructan beta-fructosidase